jgi:hypothetical protein
MDWIETKSKYGYSINPGYNKDAIASLRPQGIRDDPKQIKINKHYSDNLSLFNANNQPSTFYHQLTFDPS